MYEWMNIWMNDKRGGAPACLSHKTCPLQSQNTGAWVSPYRILVYWRLSFCPTSARWFPAWPPAHPNGSAHGPQTSHSLVPFWLQFQSFRFLERPPSASLIYGIGFFGPVSTPVFFLFALTLNCEFPLRIHECFFYCMFGFWFTCDLMCTILYMYFIDS